MRLCSTRSFVSCIACALIVLTLVISQHSTVSAQTSESAANKEETSVFDSSQLSENMTAFAPYIGTWEIDAEWEGGNSLWARSEYRVGLGGNFVEATTYAKDGDGDPYERYRTVFGRDEESGEYTSYGFTFDGTVSVVENEVEPHDGKTLIRSQFLMGTNEIKQEVVIQDSNNYGWKVWGREQGTEGDDGWSQMMDGVWKRVESTDANVVGDATAKDAIAMVTGTGRGWQELTFSDFENINCKEDTWTGEGNMIVCNGNCNGGLRSKEQYTNFEMVMEWKHLNRSGNSGVFVWAPEDVNSQLGPGALPQGIEIQVLDHGYAEDWEKSKGSPPDWFTTHGDVFPCGVADMTPFEPAAPNGKRSFPSGNYSKGVGEWNHYYIRAINGELRLWVNGHEVSGGTDCTPATGWICLEAESAPIEFRNIRVRVLK